jgi:hypothetical protein
MSKIGSANPCWLAKSPFRALQQGGNDDAVRTIAVAAVGAAFIALVCAGYVAVALAYYFMFNHANLQL